MQAKKVILSLILVIVGGVISYIVYDLVSNKPVNTLIRIEHSSIDFESVIKDDLGDQLANAKLEYSVYYDYAAQKDQMIDSLFSLKILLREESNIILDQIWIIGKEDGKAKIWAKLES